MLIRSRDDFFCTITLIISILILILIRGLQYSYSCNSRISIIARICLVSEYLLRMMILHVANLN